MASLSGRAALVTGSSRGIGRAIALAFAAAGADVAVHCHTAKAEAEEVAAAVRRLGRRAVSVQADVRRDEEVAAEFGPAGVRINALLVTWAENAFDPADPDQAAFLPSFALRRVVAVDEIAKAAVFLCSEAAAGVTGAALPVDADFLCG